MASEAMTVREAHCACGALALKAEGDPIGQGVCSCLDCQWRTGSVISVNALYDEVRVTVSGASNTWQRTGDSGGAPTTFHFCPTCGSTLYWKPGWREGVLCVAVGCFADKDFPTPKMSVYGERRPRWVCLADGIEEYAE